METELCIQTDRYKPVVDLTFPKYDAKRPPRTVCSRLFITDGINQTDMMTRTSNDCRERSGVSCMSPDREVLHETDSGGWSQHLCTYSVPIVFFMMLPGEGLLYSEVRFLYHGGEDSGRKFKYTLPQWSWETLMLGQ